MYEIFVWYAYIYDEKSCESVKELTNKNTARRKKERNGKFTLHQKYKNKSLKNTEKKHQTGGKKKHNLELITESNILAIIRQATRNTNHS